MQNLVTAFEVVYPLMVMILIGIAVRRTGMVSENSLEDMNKLIYKLFYPALMFHNVMASDFGSGLNAGLYVFLVVLLLVVFLILLLLIPLWEKNNKRRGVLIQGIYRSNFLVFGMAMVTTLYGTDNLGPIIMLAAIAVPFMNGMSVVALEIFRGGKPNIAKILVNVCKNPVIIATVLAFGCKQLGGYPLQPVMESVSKVATPFALIVIGASFRFGSVKNYRRPLLWGIAGKLLMVPAVIVPVCALAGLRGAELLSFLAIFGGPAATSSFAMAQQMGGDSDLAASMVVCTSCLSIVTFFGWILLLKTMALL